MKMPVALLAGMMTLCVGCVPPAANDQELAAALENVRYDYDVVADLQRYELLSSFLQTHVDTLIAARNVANMVTFVNGSRDGLRDTTYAVSEKCHVFYEGNDRCDMRTAPAYLQHALDSLYHQFTKQRVQSFEVCEEGRVVICVRQEVLTETLSATHELIWDPNGKKERPKTSTYVLDRDTLLQDGVIYRIGLVENRGR